MSRLLVLVDRLLPSLLIAAAVMLLAGGLISLGDRSIPTTPSRDRVTIVEGPSPTATTPTARRAPSSPPTSDVVATRVVIRSVGVDLPVVSRDLRVPDQGPDRYPPCDVAVYHTAFGQPGQPGATYLYAHAREGMFLPLLEASVRHDGASLLGALVEVYTSDDQRHVYQVTLVKRHAVDFSLALDVPAGEERLVLQTSEGPSGTVPKLQILAEPVGVEPAAHRQAHPRAEPRPCYDE
jgi:hypothetical protein